MKTLLLMRHAKTESPYLIKRDLERRLTSQGEQDARQVGNWLLRQGIRIDRILSSPAIRTQQTTQGICEAMGLNHSIIELKEELYHPAPETFVEVIQRLPNETDTALIVSHNDGITLFANQLTDATVDYMQPGSVFAVSCTCDDWGKFSVSEREFLFYKQPTG